MATRHSGRAARILSQHLNGPTYIEGADGLRIRVWGDPNEDWTRPEDVRNWLNGKRVIEADDLRRALEYVRESYLHSVLIASFRSSEAWAP